MKFAFLTIFLLSVFPARAQTVCIDPGHPSENNSGLTIQNGVTEVQIVWKIALMVRDSLRALGYNTILTKDSMLHFRTNRQRAEIANAGRSDLFVRLHCDSGPYRGFSLYYPDRQGTRDGVTGPNQKIIKESKTVTESIHRRMKERLVRELPDAGVRGESESYVGSRQGALTGSIFSIAPVVTIEMAVLEDETDARWIASEGGQRRMAGAITAGIHSHFISKQKK